MILIDFLRFGSIAHFKVTEEFVDYAISVCREVQEKTRSRKEEDYPCRCGGWCEKDFG